jgi:hypothetical protein
MHTGEWERGPGGTSYTPSKDFGKCGQQNAIKHKNRGPPRFSHNPKNPLQKKKTVMLECNKI